MIDSDQQEFKDHPRIKYFIAVLMLGSYALAVTLLRLGALVLWSKYSPDKDGQAASWLVSIIIGVPLGLLFAGLQYLIIEHLYNRRQRNK